MHVQEVNRLLKEFEQMQGMMKKMKGGGLMKMMKRMGAMKAWVACPNCRHGLKTPLRKCVDRSTPTAWA